MIHGYIIKKIGEDIYLQHQSYGDFGWGKFPFIYENKDFADAAARQEENAEVKRADIFITP